MPSECKELAPLLTRERGAIQESRALDASAAMQLLQRCDALRRPQRFADLLQAVQCLNSDGGERIDSTQLLAALAAAQAVDSEAVSSQAMAEGARGAAIGVAVQAARESAIAASGLFAPARDDSANNTGQGQQ